jgi:Subtilase family
MKSFYKIMILAVFMFLLLPSNSSAQNYDTYILQSPNLAQAQAVCQMYGMTLLSTIHDPGTYLVQLNAYMTSDQLHDLVERDPNVGGLEINKQVNQRKHNNTTSAATPIPSSVPPTMTVTDKNLSQIYGSTAWAAYVQQPAFYSTNVYSAGIQQGNTGQGVIGIIDTGVDESNPNLAPVVIPGYDFTRNLAGSANDNGDLDQSTAHILHQSTAHILHGFTTVQLNAFSSSILDADTASALQGVTLPDDFGHGTMVAGLVHLVAPTAKIMPLKAFNADGSANESDIIRAIYYAADNGVNVLNMSFGLPNISDALMKAINYANRRGVVCVASVGNDGQTTLLYPAAFGNVIGVASVNAQNQTSAFSNRGADMVALAAPGEGLVTTYPGDHYASVSGTSFSAALVSGAADVLLFQNSKVKHSGPVNVLLFQGSNLNYAAPSGFQEPDIARALEHANSCVTDGSLGGGCMDLNQAFAYIQSMVIPATPTATSTDNGKTKN